MIKITKEEWMEVIKQTEASLKDAVLSAEIFAATIKNAKEEIEKLDAEAKGSEVPGVSC